MPPVFLALRSHDRIELARTRWLELRAIAKPFPFDTDDDELEAEAPYPCDLSENDVAAATILHSGRARICFSDGFFARSREVQLGVLLHEAAHIRLFLGRLKKGHDAMKRADQYFRGLTLSGANDEAEFVARQSKVVIALLHLSHEIGVDSYMVAEHPWVDRDVWSERARAFYQDSFRIPDERCPPALLPYVRFHRLAAAEAGLQVLPDITERVDLENARSVHEAALRAACTPELFDWLEQAKNRLLALDVSTDDADHDDYSDVAERVQRLTFVGGQG